MPCARRSCNFRSRIFLEDDSRRSCSTATSPANPVVPLQNSSASALAMLPVQAIGLVPRGQLLLEIYYSHQGSRTEPLTVGLFLQRLRRHVLSRLVCCESSCITWDSIRDSRCEIPRRERARPSMTFFSRGRNGATATWVCSSSNRLVASLAGHLFRRWLMVVGVCPIGGTKQGDGNAITQPANQPSVEGFRITLLCFGQYANVLVGCATSSYLCVVKARGPETHTHMRERGKQSGQSGVSVQLYFEYYS
jgi:hypothetical protein